ncbi:heterokaryon incompatibility protein-domain-containing protein, partial [Cladorrhinum sp. PSN259]
VCSSCGHASDRDPVEGKLVYSANLNFCLPEAIEAGQAGCELYQWVVNRILALPFKKMKWEESPDAMEHVRFKLSAWSMLEGKHCPLDVLMFNQSNTLNTSTDVRLGKFEGWTAASDPSARYIKQRPYHQIVGSPESAKFAVDCFQTCLKTHGWCRTNQISHFYQARYPMDGTVLPDEVIMSEDIPTRLLAIDDDQVRLIETKDSLGNLAAQEVPLVGFITLSYCWGTIQPITLTYSSYGSLSRGISPSALPATLRDAVEVARTIGFRYIWIDCLCIIQDSDDDKAIEIARLAQYYRRASVTICAASATACTEGFLQPHPPSPLTTGPIQIPIKLQVPAASPGGYVDLVIETPELPIEPITLRAWTFQEALLSRRMLIYGVRQLSWSSVNSYAGVGGGITTLTDRMMPGPPESVAKGIYPIGSHTALPITTQWHTLVKEYTSRNMSYGADKLLAFSALAAHMMDVLREREPKNTRLIYAAGLLAGESEELQVFSWLEGLLWFPWAAVLARRAKEYRAPSWSWASIDGIINHNYERRYNQPLATVESYHVELAVPAAPFGAVTGGYIVLKAGVVGLGHLLDEGTAPACSMSWRFLDEAEDDKRLTNHESSPIWVHGRQVKEVKERHLVLMPDCPDDRDIIAKGIVEEAQSDDSARVVLIGLAYSSVQLLTRVVAAPGEPRGIVAERAIADDGVETFRRLGTFTMKCDPGFFSNAKHRTVNLV